MTWEDRWRGMIDASTFEKRENGKGSRSATLPAVRDEKEILTTRRLVVP